MRFCAGARHTKLESIMVKRQSLHPDNEFIDEVTKEPTPEQGSRSGGSVATRVGTRAELKRAEDDQPEVERVVGSDDPDADAAKGPKSRAKLQPD